MKTSAGCHVRGTDQASTVAVGPVQCTSCLQVLGALVRGAKQDTLKPYMKVGNQLHVCVSNSTPSKQWGPNYTCFSFIETFLV